MNNERVIQALRLLFAVLGRLSPRLAGRLACKLMYTPQRFKRPWREQEWAASAVASTLNCGLAAWTWGQPEHPAVLLVHGWSGRGTQMGAFVTPLLEQGRRVIAIDGDAHGDSPGTRTNPVAFAAKLTAVGDELGPLEAVIAHSFGAATTTIAISDGLRVEKMVYIAGPAEYRQVLETVGRRLFQLPPKAFDHYVDRIEAELQGRLDDINIPEIVCKLTVPALIMHAMNDDEVPFGEGQKVANAWPGSEMASFKDLGHTRILWAPPSVNRCVEFIVTPASQPAVPIADDNYRR